MFDKHNVPQEFDLLTIDTDYNDYWIWKSILERGKYHPRVVAVDFNPDIPLDKAWAVKYQADGEWDGTRYTTASLLAYTILARKFGYEFVHALEMGVHAFFVRRELLHPTDLNLPIRAVLKSSHPEDHLKRQFVDVSEVPPPPSGHHESQSHSHTDGDSSAAACELPDMRNKVILDLNLEDPIHDLLAQVENHINIHTESR